jgi:hypothetical protein
MPNASRISSVEGMVHRETCVCLEVSAYLARIDIDSPGSTGNRPGVRTIAARFRRMGGTTIAYFSPFLQLAIVFSAVGCLADGGCRQRPHPGGFSCSAGDGWRQHSLAGGGGNCVGGPDCWRGSFVGARPAIQ